MKRLFLVAVVALLCWGGQASARQKDNYRMKVEKYLSLGGDVADMQKRISEAMHMEDIPAEALENDTLRAMFDYLQNELLEDIVDSYEVSLRKFVTEDELDELISWMQKPEYQAVHAKEQALTERILNQDTEVMAYMGTLMNGISAIIQGKKPAAMPKTKVSKEYQTLFHEYVQHSNVQNIMRQSYSNLIGQLGKMLESEPGIVAKMNKASEYATANIESILLGLYSEVYTEDDLRFYIDFCKTTAYQHQASASADFAGSIGSLIEKMFTRMGIKL